MKYCPECGAKIIEKNNFCSECGNKFLLKKEKNYSSGLLYLYLILALFSIIYGVLGVVFLTPGGETWREGIHGWILNSLLIISGICMYISFIRYRKGQPYTTYINLGLTLGIISTLQIAILTFWGIFGLPTLILFIITLIITWTGEKNKVKTS